MQGYLTTKQACEKLNPMISPRRLITLKDRVPGIIQHHSGGEILWPENFKDPRNWGRKRLLAFRKGVKK